jgi:hypothetical protein
MTMGKFLVRWLVVFILADGLGFLIHAALLRPTYTTLMQTNPGIMRADADAAGYMLWLQLAYALFAMAVVWMYGKGNTGQGWLGQGFRFGFAVWVISSVYRYLVYYFVQPWPGMVIAKQIGFEFVACLLIGIVLAGMSRNDVPTARAS